MIMYTQAKGVASPVLKNMYYCDMNINNLWVPTADGRHIQFEQDLQLSLTFRLLIKNVACYQKIYNTTTQLIKISFNFPVKESVNFETNLPNFYTMQSIVNKHKAIEC